MPITLELGKLVTYRSKNTADNVQWRGTVVGVVNHSTAKLFGDIVNYQIAVAKVDPAIPDIKTLNFFLIKLDTVNTPTKTFATEWIEDGSFVVLDAAVTTTLVVYEMTGEDREEIINILKAKGYHVTYS